MGTVPVGQAATAAEAVLPARVQEALGELVGAAREGLLALSVGVGLGVLAELMEQEVVDVVGAKGKHDADRVAVRHGHEAGAHQVGLETVDQLASYKRYGGPWRDYVTAAVGNSSMLRSVVRDQPTAWPALAPLVEAYDASHPARLAPAGSTEPRT